MGRYEEISDDETPPFLAKGGSRYEEVPEEDEDLAPSSKAALSRQFSNNTGSYEDVQAALQGDKARAKQIVQQNMTPQPDQGFFTRGFKSAAHGVNALIDVGQDVYGTQGRSLLDPAKRRQLLRGVDDVATLGYGQKLAARVGNALGDKMDTKKGELGDQPLGPETFGSTEPVTTFAGAFKAAGGAPVPNTQAADQAAAPEYRTFGQGLGSFTGAGAVIGRAGGALAKTLPGAGMLPGAARGLLAYEATAPGMAALSANAEGHRLEAAKEAATDPLGLMLSPTAGGIAGVGERPEGAPSKAGQAIKNAERWVAKDINGERAGASTPTARLQLAEDAENVSKMVLKDKVLAQAIDKATEQNVDDLKHLGSVVKERLSTVGQKLTPGWKRVDAALGDQPLTSGRVVQHLWSDVRELRAAAHTTDAAEADALEAIIKRISNGRNWGAEKTIFNPDAIVDGGFGISKPIIGPDGKVTFGPTKAGDAIATLEKMKARLGTREGPSSAAVPEPAWSTPAEREANARVRAGIPKDRIGQISRGNLAEKVAISKGERRAVSGAETARMRHLGPTAQLNRPTQSLADAWDEAERIRNGEAPLSPASFVPARPTAPEAHPMGAAADLDAEIARITDAATTKGFDPNHQISAEQLQHLWSDEAGIAYQSQGGVNGTATFNKRLDVASHLRSLRDQVLQQAAKKDPQAVAAVSGDLAQFSALKRIEQVVSQRTKNAIAQGGGASVPAEVIRRVKEIKHNPWGAVLGYGLDKAVAIKRHMDTQAARRAMEAQPMNPATAAKNQAMAQTIVRLMQSGMSQSAAILAAQAALQNGGEVPAQ